MLPLRSILHQTNQAFRRAPWLPAPFVISSMALRLVLEGRPEPVMVTAALLLHMALTAGFMASAYFLAGEAETAESAEKPAHPQDGAGVPEAGEGQLASTPLAVASRAESAAEANRPVAGASEAFFVGVGRHFAGMTVGHGVLAFAALAFAGGVIGGVAERWPLPSEAMLKELSRQARSGVMLSQAQLDVLLPWAWTMVGLALPMLLAMLALTAWKQVLVAKPCSWWSAFRESTRFVGRRFRLVMALLGIEALVDVLLLPLLFVREPFFVALGDLGLVIVHAWTSLALMVAWVGERRVAEG